MEAKDQNTDKPAEKGFLQKHFALRHIVGVIAGATAGFFYYRIVGCSSGACPLNSNPWLMSGMGIIIGYLIGDLFSPRKRKI